MYLLVQKTPISSGKLAHEWNFLSAADEWLKFGKRNNRNKRNKKKKKKWEQKYFRCINPLIVDNWYNIYI